MRPSRAGIQYRITWAGYDQTYDTWEPRENVLDSRLIKDFETTLELSIPLQQPMGQLREAVAKALTAMKHPMQGMCVDVPLAALLGVARAVIERAAKPPSRRGCAVISRAASAVPFLDHSLDFFPFAVSTTPYLFF